MRLLPSAWVLRTAPPFPDEVAAAKGAPDGKVYRVAGKFSPDEKVPAEAVFGVWTVDAKGEIVGGLRPNLNYDPKRYPPVGGNWVGWGLLIKMRLISSLSALLMTAGYIAWERMRFSLPALLTAMCVLDAFVSLCIVGPQSLPLRFKITFGLISFIWIYSQFHLATWM
jgi:hypothetical protein